MIFFGSLGRYIKRVRLERGWRQSDLAERLRVSRAVLWGWESGDRPVPAERLSDLGAALSIDVDQLRVLWIEPAGVEPTPVSKVKAPRYTIQGTLDDISEVRARIVLCDAEWDEIEHALPRDTKYELAAALHLLHGKGRLTMCAPLSVGCPLHIVSSQDLAPAGHLLHHCIVVRGETRELIAWPQVSLLVLSQSRVYRVDFLVLWRGRAVRLWCHVEIDGGYHRETADDDARRAYGLKLPRLAFTNAETLNPNFRSRLIERLKSLEADRSR